MRQMLWLFSLSSPFSTMDQEGEAAAQTWFSWAQTAADGGADGFQPGFLKKNSVCDRLDMFILLLFHVFYPLANFRCVC